MYAYYVFAIIAGLAFLWNGFTFILKTKSYTKRYSQRHFKKSKKAFDLLNIIFSIILGLMLIIFAVLAFIPTISFENHDLIFCLIFTIIIALALLVTIILEHLYLEKEEIKSSK